MIKLITTIAFLLLIGSPSFAASKNLALGLEINPIPYVVFLVPGGSMIDIRGELIVSQYVSINVEYSHFGLNLGEESFNTLKEKSDEDDVLAKKVSSQSIGPGIRLYSSAFTDSFYFGINVLFGKSNINYLFHEEEIKAESTTLASAADFGYRWLWKNGFQLRLGGILTFPQKESTDYTTAQENDQSSEGVEKLKETADENGMKTLATIDLGLGVLF